MKRRSGWALAPSPSPLRTTCASQTFSASVFPTALLPSLRSDGLHPLNCSSSTEPARLRNRPVKQLASQILRRQYHYMDNSSGVGVIDKAAQVLDALEA